MADILVVDDDENICAAFKQFLKEEGHSPLIASNAHDALSYIKESHPDLVFMDIRMPGTDGLEALRRIRESDSDLSVVIMTAYGTSQTSIDAARLGAYEYLMKPLAGLRRRFGHIDEADSLWGDGERASRDVAPRRLGDRLLDFR